MPAGGARRRIRLFLNGPSFPALGCYGPIAARKVSYPIEWPTFAIKKLSTFGRHCRAGGEGQGAVWEGRGGTGARGLIDYRDARRST